MKKILQSLPTLALNQSISSFLVNNFTRIRIIFLYNTNTIMSNRISANERSFGRTIGLRECPADYLKYWDNRCGGASQGMDGEAQGRRHNVSKCPRRHLCRTAGDLPAFTYAVFNIFIVMAVVSLEYECRREGFVNHE